MGKFIDLTGKIFGSLTVLSYNGADTTGHSTWSCLCICGNSNLDIKLNYYAENTLEAPCFSAE